MPQVAQEQLEKKRDDIKHTLAWFEISLLENDLNRLMNDEVVDPCSYLDHYLIPRVGRFFSNKIKSLTPNKETVWFYHYLSLCFNGELSMKAWDEVWSLLTDEDKIFCASTSYYLGRPIEIAAEAGYLEGLTRLKNIYQHLLPQYPEYTYALQQNLQAALRICPQTDEQKQCFKLALDWCLAFASEDPVYEEGSVVKNFSRMLFIKSPAEKIEGKTIAPPQYIPLLEVFTELCEGYIEKHNFLALQLVLEFIDSSMLSHTQFDSLNVRLNNKLKVFEFSQQYIKTVIEIVNDSRLWRDKVRDPIALLRFFDCCQKRKALGKRPAHIELIANKIRCNQLPIENLLLMASKVGYESHIQEGWKATSYSLLCGRNAETNNFYGILKSYSPRNIDQFINQLNEFKNKNQPSNNFSLNKL